MALKVLLIGKSGRLDCMAEALTASKHNCELHILSEVDNFSLSAKGQVWEGRSDDLSFVEDCARQISPDFSVIGPEEPLHAGVVDLLADLDIPSVGPNKSLARLESSKSFTRELMTLYKISGNPEYRYFKSMHGVSEYLERLGEFVVKPDGLTGGKGVRVFGEHLDSIREALDYCEHLVLDRNSGILIEEKLEGEEFSLQSFFDGSHIVHMPPVQDHKRAKEDDLGPNTGGMGSYSCADHRLPFLSAEHLNAAREINRRVGEAVSHQVGQPYKGVLYGGFMVTANGVRVIEYNARFGDPEVMNVLPLMDQDFVDVCQAIIRGRLSDLRIGFREMATVCKYVVPTAYPDASSGGKIDVSSATRLEGYGDRIRLYFGAVTGETETSLQLLGSRAVACLGIGKTLDEAERSAEEAALAIKGPVFHRRDIGTANLIRRRMAHVAQLQTQYTRRAAV